MLAQIFLAVAFIPACMCLLAGREKSPFTSKEYQSVIGQGLSTSWFKHRKRYYNGEMVEDAHAKGFRNLRIRCNTEFYGYNTGRKFERFLNNLEDVVDKCLKVGIAPIITWLNREAETFATDEARENYVNWWRAVAERLKKKNYLLSFNLFEELHEGRCLSTSSPGCPDSLHVDTDKYNEWTSMVVEAIRGTEANNENRIVILTSPKTAADGLHLINKNIYENDDHMMVEFHLYATGPNQAKRSRKYWIGDGTEGGRDQVRNATTWMVKEFTEKTGIYPYFGAWMPYDNLKGKLEQWEVLEFAKFFANQLKQLGIPWTLNALHLYYDVDKCEDTEGRECGWFTTPQVLRPKKLPENVQTMDMAKVLQTITDNM